MIPLDPNWCLIEDHFDLAKTRHYESILALGSGWMTVRSSLDEGLSDDDQAFEYNRFMGNTSLEVMRAAKSKWGAYIPVIQGRHPFLQLGIANLPCFLGLEIYADGEKLDMETGQVHDYCRWLDLKTATLHRTLTWQTRAGQRIAVRFQRFMDPAQRFVCVQTCGVEMLSGSAEIGVIHRVDNNVRTNGFDKFTHTAVGECGRVIYSDVTTNFPNRVVTASAAVISHPVQWAAAAEARRISAQAAFRLAEGEGALITKVSAVAADAYFPAAGLLETAVELVAQNLAHGAPALHQAHCAAWEALWAQADIQIEAQDPPGYNSQLAIRTALYHLLRARAAGEDRGLLCPKGLTADTYYGSVFWDMEFFMQPFYLYTLPEVGRGGPMFRYHTLEAARQLARQTGYPGARYPWQSAFNGEETCSLWQYADHQVHITADVALGVWHYYQASGDRDFLFDYGAEILVETARYWTGRVDTIPGRPGYQILGVMGPDEYKPLTNNNAYTNYTARLNLELAVQVLDMLRQAAPEQWEQLTTRLQLEPGEVARFAEIAAGLALPQDEARSLIWQCDDFEQSFAELDIEGIWQDRTRLFGAYVSQEKRYRSKCLKQADVVALLAVFPAAFSPAQKAAALDYYLPYTIHDSSNSMCHHGMLAADLGRAGQAYEFWLKSIDIDFGRLPRSADGIHMANVGGMWQEIVFGFCGMASALNSPELAFKPCLPPEIRRIACQVAWQGRRVALTLTEASLVVENLSAEELTFRVGGVQYHAPAHARVEAPYAR